MKIKSNLLLIVLLLATFHLHAEVLLQENWSTGRIDKTVWKVYDPDTNTLTAAVRVEPISPGSRDFALKLLGFAVSPEANNTPLNFWGHHIKRKRRYIYLSGSMKDYPCMKLNSGIGIIEL